MALRYLALIALMGCGRVGYSPLSGDADQGAPDARGDVADGLVGHSDSLPIDARPVIDAAMADSNPLSAGLLAWYPLETVSANEVEDASGNGHTGTCDRGCPEVVAGRVDNAFAFDELTAIRIPDNGAFQTPDALTIAAWIYPDPLAYAAPLSKPLDQPNGVKDSWQFELDGSGRVAFTTAGPSGHFVDYASGVRLDGRRWVHLAGTWDGTRKRFYIDGELQYELRRDVAFDDADIIIGGDENDGGPALMFPGRIDDVRIYDRALSEAEIRALAGR